MLTRLPDLYVLLLSRMGSRFRLVPRPFEEVWSRCLLLILLWFSCLGPPWKVHPCPLGPDPCEVYHLGLSPRACRRCGCCQHNHFFCFYCSRDPWRLRPSDRYWGWSSFNNLRYWFICHRFPWWRDVIDAESCLFSRRHLMCPDECRWACYWTVRRKVEDTSPSFYGTICISWHRDRTQGNYTKWTICSLPHWFSSSTDQAANSCL